MSLSQQRNLSEEPQFMEVFLEEDTETKMESSSRRMCLFQLMQWRQQKCST